MGGSREINGHGTRTMQHYRRYLPDGFYAETRTPGHFKACQCIKCCGARGYVDEFDIDAWWLSLTDELDMGDTVYWHDFTDVPYAEDWVHKYLPLTLETSMFEAVCIVSESVEESNRPETDVLRLLRRCIDWNMMRIS